jgi:predicted membrane-bound spermidine synthase
MRFARGLLIFSYGLFTIAAQALLFRDFLTTFEGSDISVGVFFGTWFLWVGLGALLVYKAGTFAEKLLKNIEFLFLCYLPAFIAELVLIIQARELAGVAPYALLPIKTIVLLSIVVNAPVSVITGMLFPIACRWVQDEEELAVSHVYIIEAAGSFLGGLGTTLLLGAGVSSARIFFILTLIVSLSFLFVRLEKSKKLVWAFVPICIFVCLIAGVDKKLSQQLQIIKWEKLLPKDALKGSFQTAQAEYLYGVYQDQWVAVREGSTCETLPDKSSAGRIAAIGLCQNPDAKRVLVVGSGLGLCYQFLNLKQIEKVTWAHSDSEYVREVDRFIPPEFKVSDKRFHRLSGDVRSLLADEKQYYDLVVLNLPDATSSVLNRYYTLEFYRRIKETLRPGGVLAVRITGGENIMGTELINLGGSTKLTLEKVFSQIVLTPGEDTWFIASDSGKLTGDPGSLRDRFATIKGGAGVFPPEALLSVYLPDRAAAALESYSGADLPENLLINRDSRPLTHLYSLLLAAKQSGAPGTKFVKYLVLAGPLAFVVPILVFIALRAIYILREESRGLKTVQQGDVSTFDSSFLVFSAGWVGIGVVIVLMYLYQTCFGSLYLYIGVISSVFMVGLTAGAALISYFLSPRSNHRLPITSYQLPITSYQFAVILVHTLILAAIIFWPSEQWTHRSFAVAFFLCGLCTGCYFPLAARQLADSALESGQAGSKLETADHIGASAGGLLTGLALVPVLGTKVTLFIFILLVLANIPPAVLRLYRPEKVRSLATTVFRLRRLGYILFGIALSVILCSNLLAKAAVRLRPSLPRYAAQALAGNARLEPVSMVSGEDGRKINYFRVYDANDKLNGYIFSSADLAPEVAGFGGKMNLAIYVDATGRLINFHIISSNETPSYLDLLIQWRGLLSGHKLFQPEPFAGINATTGATISSKAILSALEKSGRRFAGEVLSRVPPPRLLAQQARGPDINGVYLICAFVLAFIVIYRGGFWSRLATLCFNLLVGGIILNAQYSSEQIATVLSLHAPAIGLSGAFLSVLGIPLLVIIFGNIFCGYICPFGVMQELLGYVVPRRFKPATGQIPVESIQKARFVKYVVLFVLIMVFFVSRNRTTLAADPLIAAFSGSSAMYTVSVGLIIAIALTGSIFYTRFWCRYLCPVGALLSLLNNCVVLKRFLPAKRFSRCEFGLTAKDQMDCLYCDRCRYQTKDLGFESVATRPASYLSRHLVVIAVLVGIFVSAVSVERFLQVIPAGISQPVASVSGIGRPRDVDLQRINTMIQQRKLSDKEAEFYKKTE